MSNPQPFNPPFSVHIGDAIVLVDIDGADSLEDAALQAAVSARESLLNAKAIVVHTETGTPFAFSKRDMEEFWA